MLISLLNFLFLMKDKATMAIDVISFKGYLLWLCFSHAHTTFLGVGGFIQYLML